MNQKPHVKFVHVSKSQRDLSQSVLLKCSIKQSQFKELTLHVCVRWAIKLHGQPVIKGYSYLNVFHFPFAEIRYKHRCYRPHSQVKMRASWLDTQEARHWWWWWSRVCNWMRGTIIRVRDYFYLGTFWETGLGKGWKSLNESNVDILWSDKGNVTARKSSLCKSLDIKSFMHFHPVHQGSIP